MALADTITGLNTGTYTVTRRGPGTYTDGIYTRGAVTSTFLIVAVLQPATGMQRVVPGKDMLPHADGQVVDEVLALHTKTVLRPAIPTGEADYVTIDGASWIVFRVETWNLSGQIFCRAVVARDTAGGQ